MPTTCIHYDKLTINKTCITWPRHNSSHTLEHLLLYHAIISNSQHGGSCLLLQFCCRLPAGRRISLRFLHELGPHYGLLMLWLPSMIINLMGCHMHSYPSLLPLGIQLRRWRHRNFSTILTPGCSLAVARSSSLSCLRILLCPSCCSGRISSRSPGSHYTLFRRRVKWMIEKPWHSWRRSTKNTYYRALCRYN